MVEHSYSILSILVTFSRKKTLSINVDKNTQTSECSGRSNWTKATPQAQPTMVTSSPNWYGLHLINVSESINQVNYRLAPSPIHLIIQLGTMTSKKTEKTKIKVGEEVGSGCSLLQIGNIGGKKKYKQTIHQICHSCPRKHSFDSHLCLSKDNSSVLWCSS